MDMGGATTIHDLAAHVEEGESVLEPSTTWMELCRDGADRDIRGV